MMIEFSCEICGKISSIYEYKQDIQNTNIKNIPIYCSVCTKQYDYVIKKANNANRRCRTLGIAGIVTASDLLDIYDKQNGRCLYSNVFLSLNEFSLDHFIPLSRGGTNYKSNLVICLNSMNISKNNKIMCEWKHWNGITPVYWDGSYC